ncbi:MAG: T9SS type A sorting domain-containing protein [Ignavibacterium sp.]|nr:T9SS type A sorting domain-containing protein [Ignavibacterium sp.]
MKRGDLFQIVPVELASFIASVNGNDVSLNWMTASEINNRGFEVERQDLSTLSSVSNSKYEVIGFIEGQGTTTEVNRYSFTDKGLTPGTYQYRIKQIDFDGTFKFYNLAETIEIGVPDRFVLEQNYPNPFNPSTKIRYHIPSVISTEGKNLNVQLKVYDVLGNEVTTLVNEYHKVGSYEVIFDASNLPSGTYFYRLQAGETTDTKKLILIK